MTQNGSMNIRKLLKTFGIQADEAVVAFFSQNTDVKLMTIRLTLEDVTEYDENESVDRLVVQVEGQVNA